MGSSVGIKSFFKLSPNRSARTEPSSVLGLLCFVAVSCPFLFGYGTLPLTNFAGEIVSVAGFAMMFVVTAQYGAADRKIGDLKLVWTALGLLILATAGQYFYFEQKNLVDWLAIIGYLFLAAMAAWVGNTARGGGYKRHWQKGIAIALIAGATLASVASIAQYVSFDASWIVLSPAAEKGRTFGFVRQPNHQATFLCLGLAALFTLRPAVGRRLGAVVFLLLGPLLVFGIVSTGSRAALLQLLFISVCAVLFLRRNNHGAWKAFYPLVFAAVIWTVLLLISQHGGADFYGANKLTQTRSEGVGMRAEVWRQTIDLIHMRPWLGWGILDYGSAFFLSGAAEKAGIVMTHSHNLFLQLAFAFGLPLTAGFLFLLAAVFWRARRQLLTLDGFLPFVAVGCVAIHSQVEFPLWYTYFLLPTSYFIGWLSRGEVQLQSEVLPGTQGNSSQVLAKVGGSARKGVISLLGLTILGTVVWMNNDYYKLTPVFAVGLKSDLNERLDVASHVTWFRPYASYLLLIRQTVDASNYQEYLRTSTELGCVMYETWYQPNTIVALTFAGKPEEAKWIMYSYWRLSGGEVAQFRNALIASKAPGADEMLRYLNGPVPVPRAMGLFNAACYAGRS